jgi:prepilin-type N-terminal cleavage/methylation domain-containing protein
MEATWIGRRLAAAEEGFTLIELMIVVVIMGIVTMLAIPSYLSLKNRALDSANKANVRSIIAPIASYYADHLTYVGMTLPGLAVYDQALDSSKYTLGGITANSYCIQSPQGSGPRVWRKNGPAATIDNAHC